MNACGTVKDDERTLAMLWANTWGLNFLLFALLADIIYRSLVLQDAPWDLFALIIVTGIINFAYCAKHQLCVINRKTVLVLLITAVVAAIVAAVVALTKT